jgi:prepilin-type N-terminal cleavage/methylation domain-containing protein
VCYKYEKYFMKSFYKGFSLVEILIVLAIATIMTAVVLVSMSAERKDKNYLEMEGRKVEALIAAQKNGALDGVGSVGDCTFGVAVDGNVFEAVGCNPVSYKASRDITFKERKVFYFTSPNATLFDNTTGTPVAVGAATGITVTLQKNSQEYEIKIN